MSIQEKCDQHHPAINAGYNAFTDAHDAALDDAETMSGVNPVKLATWKTFYASAKTLMKMACNAAKNCAEDAGGDVSTETVDPNKDED